MHRRGRKRKGDDNEGRNGPRGKRPRPDKGSEADLKKNNDDVAAVEKRVEALRKVAAEHEALQADAKKAVENNAAEAAALPRTHNDERKALCKETADARKRLGERVVAVVAKLFPNDASIEAAQGALRLKGPVDVAASLYRELVAGANNLTAATPPKSQTQRRNAPKEKTEQRRRDK
eukprot:Rhum_TRINITY_DN14432_c1_g2::Rhum_TRINITY_DN14432_c1_g2_i1::g.90906::m.90906